jgi:hypothetical protein
MPPKGCKIMGLAAPIATMQINSFDWFTPITGLPNSGSSFYCVEGSFQRTKRVLRNTEKSTFIYGVIVATVKASPGHDIGNCNLWEI